MISLFKKSGVQSVIGLAKKTNTFVYSGRQLFDRRGRVIEEAFPTSRRTYKYDYRSRVVEIKSYLNDTSKLYQFSTNDFDSNGFKIKETSGIYLGGQLSTTVRKTEILSRTKYVIRKKTTFLQDNKSFGYVLETDSFSAPYTFHISSELMGGVVYAIHGKKFVPKVVTRRYTLNNFIYEDFIASKAFSDNEIFNGCSSNYKQLDENGRVIETGELNYTDTLRSIAFNQSQKLDPDVVPSSFVKALYKGFLRSKRYTRPTKVVHYIYESKGNLGVTEPYNEGTTIIYNEKQQLIEISHSGEFKAKSTYQYNELGLLIKSSIYRYSEGLETTEEEYRYEYSFFK